MDITAITAAASAVGAQHLPGILHALEPALDHYGYLAVAGFVLVEDFGVPVPGETILILGAVYAGTGRLNVIAVALIGFLAAVLGDNVGFLAGRRGGRTLIERYGRYLLITPQRLEKGAGFFDRHGAKIVVGARFIEGLRQANGILAGISPMHWARFLTYNAIGAALWVGVWTTVGYASGSHIDSVYATAARYERYLAIAAGLVVLLCLARWLRHLSTSRIRSDADGSPEGALANNTIR